MSSSSPAKSMSIIVTKGTLDWAYPPFILFNAERPLELAQLIKTTLTIDQPIEDRTR